MSSRLLYSNRPIYNIQKSIVYGYADKWYPLGIQFVSNEYFSGPDI